MEVNLLVEEIRALSEEDISKELEATHRELMNLRFRAATRQLAQTGVVREARRKLAKIKTVMRERELIREKI